mmetsp:Transcript_27762/g.89392  ORF Transcript_27762/g.89392 Transcript_27762/m.89392 type:complete len:290 (-) Transcript_27762:6777-7646(-)
MMCVGAMRKRTSRHLRPLPGSLSHFFLPGSTIAPQRASAAVEITGWMHIMASGSPLSSRCSSSSSPMSSDLTLLRPQPLLDSTMRDTSDAHCGTPPVTFAASLSRPRHSESSSAADPYAGSTHLSSLFRCAMPTAQGAGIGHDSSMADGGSGGNHCSDGARLSVSLDALSGGAHCAHPRHGRAITATPSISMDVAGCSCPSSPARRIRSRGTLHSTGRTLPMGTLSTMSASAVRSSSSGSDRGNHVRTTLSCASAANASSGTAFTTADEKCGVDPAMPEFCTITRSPTS